MFQFCEPNDNQEKNSKFWQRPAVNLTYMLDILPGYSGEKFT